MKRHGIPASQVLRTSPLYDSVEIIREKPPIPDTYCKRCCRLLHWFKNPKETRPNVWQSVCCDRVHFEEAR